MWQEIHDKNKWNDSVSKKPHAPFLQSWNWGQFQESLGRQVLRLSWEDKVFVQIIKMNLPGGLAYWYIPRGPVVIDEKGLSAEAWQELVKMLGEHGTLFLRVDPVPELATLVRYGAGPIRQIPSTQPQCTLILDLSPTPEQLLSNFHSKTRYNIKLAQKKGVTIGTGSTDEFLRLNHVTAKRGGFITHPDGYYRQMTKVFNPLLVWQATHKDKVLASVLIAYFGDTATFLHGASSNEYRQVKAPSLLRWQIIQEVQKNGFRYYDCWGVNPEDENHSAYKKSWQGLTHFKRGFGGELICYPSSFDLIYRRGWYSLYRLLRSVKAILKSY